ncbi:CPBP family intramembrane glutamic endopeptidase [Eubacteriales bacterium KG127]
MKNIYKISIIYTFIMAIGMFVCKHLYNVSYGNEKFIATLLPFLIVLLPFSVLSFNKHRKEIKYSLPRYKLFMILFIPVILVSIFAIIKKAEFSYSFFITLIGALLVGVNEELVYRGIIFTNAVGEKGLMKGIFISATAFSLLHAVNILGGLTLGAVIVQLISTFIAGLFFATSYRYTKNIWILVVYHGLWDYISLSEIGRLYPVIDGIIRILLIIELIITLVLIIKYKKEVSHIKKKTKK